jgi:hypothetical protein
MTKISILGLALIFLMFQACNDAPASQWTYTGYDSTGTQIVTGWIELQPQPNDSLTGDWKLDPVGQHSNIGPQVGTGTYQGYQSGLEIFLELNPEYMDNNVSLKGIVAGNTWSGTWEYTGFAGRINHGTFSASQ